MKYAPFACVNPMSMHLELELELNLDSLSSKTGILEAKRLPVLAFLIIPLCVIKIDTQIHTVQRMTGACIQPYLQ